MPHRTGYVEKFVNDATAVILKHVSRIDDRTGFETDDDLDDYISEYLVDFISEQRADTLLDLMMELGIGPDNEDLISVYNDSDGDWYSAILTVIDLGVHSQVFDRVNNALAEEHQIRHHEQVIGSRRPLRRR